MAAGELVAEGRRRSAEGDLKGALEAFEAAIPFKGNDPEFLFEVAGLLRQSNMHAEALPIYDALAAALPDSLPVLHNRANCLADLGRAQEAVIAFRDILTRHPDGASSWAGLGDAAFVSGSPYLGKRAYSRAIALDPKRPASYINFAEALVADAVGDDEQERAVTLLRRAIALVPDDSMLRYNLARSLLSLGRFAEGWTQYEGRLHPAGRNYVVRAIPCPRWRGEPLAGRHLFVCGEQGIGDQLWLLPFVREAAAQAGHVTLDVAPKLVPLVSRSLPEVTVRPMQIEKRDGTWHALGESRTGPERADLFIEAGSLPLFLWDRMVGRPVEPVLKPDPALAERWRHRLDEKGPGLRVGICWRSPLSGRERSPEYLPLDTWRPIFDALSRAEGGPVRVYCFQHGDVEHEIAQAPRSVGMEVVRFPDLDLWDDLHGTAAVMANMDLVITALTSTARIAAGLGIPTLVLMKTPYFVAPSDGRDPTHPTLEPVFQVPGRVWPEGIVGEVAARLATRLKG
ncbi:tetratricopeptide repeat protein [Azospirillum sp.]|uniref:tetratricopeptide repeat-containing glycosyltransferase family protein n=1 Tax=Azospirillum sp. TaxID=34012 RepID=UPI003D70DA63